MGKECYLGLFESRAAHPQLLKMFMERKFTLSIEVEDDSSSSEEFAQAKPEDLRDLIEESIDDFAPFNADKVTLTEVK